MGPLIHETAYRDMVGALQQARDEGGEVTGGERVDTGASEAFYVEPAVVRMPEQTAIVHTETFAPILYVLTYDTLDEAIELNNAVPQGCRRPSSPPMCGRRSGSWLPTVRTAASPT